MNTRETLNYTQDGYLQVGGCRCVDLAKQYGTPLYVMDEAYIEDMCKAFSNCIKEEYGDGLVLYASKAFCCKEIYHIIEKFGLGADVVSAGEILTAVKAGFDPNKLYFQGNNKTELEIRLALDNNVSVFVSDSLSEVELINNILKDYPTKTVRVMLRINPGIEAHTHHYVQTAMEDSKFGVDFKTGKEVIKKILEYKNIKFEGIHCHIGSQIYEEESFIVATSKMAEYIAELKKEFNVDVNELNMGGGFGIYQSKGDERVRPGEYAKYLRAIERELKKHIDSGEIKKPKLLVEPGRAIVGEAGITLYEVGAIKEIENIRKFVCINGGMFENPRYALYQATHEAVSCIKTDEIKEKITLAGKCCESGDLISENILLPPVKRGDFIAVLSTGAYNYSMASNYNRNPIPPVVMVKNGKSRVIVKGQTYDDLSRYDV